MLILFALTITFMTDKGLPFSAIVCLGVWNRESALFLAPVWLLTRQWKRGIALAAIAMAAFLLPRIVTPSAYNYASYIHDGYKQSVQGYSLSAIVSGVILSWQGMWLLIISSFITIPRRLKIVALALATGAMASCFVITSHDYGDYERMFSILAPVIVPCTAFVIERALHQSRFIVFLIASLCVLTFLFGNAYVFQITHGYIRHVLTALSALLSFIICGYVAFVASKHICASSDIPFANLPSDIDIST